MLVIESSLILPAFRDDKNTRAREYLRQIVSTRKYLIPAHKRVGYGYHTIRTRGYSLPAKN